MVAINWIKCSDRMPKIKNGKSIPLAVYCDYCVDVKEWEKAILYFNNINGLTWYCERNMKIPFDVVTHWAEITPPEDDQNER